MTEPRPFIVYTLPRSQSAWAAKFLTYGRWRCGHEQAIFLRHVADIGAYFGQPMTGAVETAAAQAWRIIQHQVPNLTVAVIRRPVDDVVRSMLEIDLGGAFVYDEAKLRKNMEYGDRMLAEVAAQPGVLSLTYDDLGGADGCAALFEHCLGQPFDRAWWLEWRDQNVQVNVPDHIRYYHDNFVAINRLKAELWAELRRLRRAGAIMRERGS